MVSCPPVRNPPSSISPPFLAGLTSCRLNGIGRVNHFADIWRIVKERRSSCPVVPPGLPNRGEGVIPFGLELRELSQPFVNYSNLAPSGVLYLRYGDTTQRKFTWIC